MRRAKSSPHYIKGAIILSSMLRSMARAIMRNPEPRERAGEIHIPYHKGRPFVCPRCGIHYAQAHKKCSRCGGKPVLSNGKFGIS